MFAGEKLRSELNEIGRRALIHEKQLDFFDERLRSTAGEERRRNISRARERAKVKNEGEIKAVLLTPGDSPAANYAFDVTPARLVTGLITERGVFAASRDGLATLASQLGL